MKIYNEHINLYKYIEKSSITTETEKITSDLLRFIEHYVNTSTIQFERIQKDIKLIPVNVILSNSLETTEMATRLFSDIYFYINSFSKVINLYKTLCKHLDDEPMYNIISNYGELKNYRKTRNAIEHIDEKILNFKTFKGDFDIISDQTIELNGIKISLNESSLDLLYSFYDEILIRINELVEPNREYVDKLNESFEYYRKNHDKIQKLLEDAINSH